MEFTICIALRFLPVGCLLDDGLESVPKSKWTSGVSWLRKPRKGQHGSGDDWLVESQASESIQACGGELWVFISGKAVSG